MFGAELVIPEAAKGFWAVLRHGGRSNNSWRLAYSARDPVDAHEHFRKMDLVMRQGGLVLVSPDGKVIRKNAHPLLRSRW